MSQPLGAEEGADLAHALAADKTEVCVHHLHLDSIPQVDRDPKRATRLQSPRDSKGWQRTGLDQAGRKRRQDRISIKFLLDLEHRVEVEIHPEATGDQIRLIYRPVRARPMSSS